MSSLQQQSPYGQYINFLSQGVFAFQRDIVTGNAVFFPRVVAPRSGSVALEWEVSQGLGRVYATTTVHYRGEQPLNVALISMDEGFRVMSRVEGIGPDDVTIGMRVCVRINKAQEGSDPYPVFVPFAQSRDKLKNSKEEAR